MTTWEAVREQGLEQPVEPQRGTPMGGSGPANSVQGFCRAGRARAAGRGGGAGVRVGGRHLSTAPQGGALPVPSLPAGQPLLIAKSIVSGPLLVRSNQGVLPRWLITQ